MTEGREPGAASGKVGVVTIAARNYLASVILLGESLRRVMPDWQLTAVLLDADEHELERLSGRWPWLRFEAPSSLAIEPATLSRMCLYYDLTEFATAIKPSALRQQLEWAEVAIYLDPDIEVFADLSALATGAAEHGIALTPHVMAPTPRDFKETSEESFLTTGQFNLGFIAVGQAGRPFLDYWAARLERYALVDFARGYFTDQRWVDAVPVLFEHEIIRDPGCNVAYWNLHQRSLSEAAGGGFLVDGLPLRFFHYSGHDAREPLTLSKYAPRTRVDVGASATLRRILLERAARIEAVEVETPSYRFSSLGDGRRVPSELRRGYWQAVEDAARAGAPPPPAPSWTGTSAAFDRWLGDIGPSGLPRLATLLWQGSEEGRSLFPDPERARTGAFAGWLLEEACFSALADETQRRALQALRDRPPIQRPIGVNLLGYLAGEFGMGEYGRNIAASIRAAGLPVASIGLHAEGHSHREELPASRSDAPYAINVAVVNADMLGSSVVSSEAWEAIQPRPTVGVWAWELARMPASMAASSILVDELWCGSGFIADALLASGVSCPVHVHPWLVEEPAQTHRTRADLGLPEEAFLFGFAFDFRSVLRRKNPQGLIEAYLSAFEQADGAALVIKTMNGGGGAELEGLRSLVEGRRDVLILDEVWSAGEMRAFYQLVDAYASLHRSEGIGLGMLQAMAAGTPVLATGYSGNVDFMSSEVARLVAFDMAPVGEHAAPYPAEEWWAEPSVRDAALAMQHLAADPVAAAALGRRGASHVLSLFSRARASAWFTERLDRLAGI